MSLEFINEILLFLIKNTLLSTIIFFIIFFLQKTWIKNSYSAQSILWFLFIARLFLPANQWFELNPLAPVYEQSTLLFSNNLSFDSGFGIENNGVETSTIYHNSLKQIIFYLWVIGIITFLMIFFHKRYFFMRIRNKSRNCHSSEINSYLNEIRSCYKINRMCKIVFTQLHISPFVIGFFKPTLVIPHRMTKAGLDENLKSIIAHELAHVKRNDDFKIIVLAIIQAIYFFNPLVWIAVKKISLIREIQCDQLVLKNKIVSAKNLGKALLNVSAYPLKTQLVYILAMANLKSEMKNRILALKGERYMFKNKYLFIVLTIVMSFLVISMADPFSFNIVPEAKTNAGVESGSFKFKRPINEFRITSTFGMRKHPILKNLKMHNGIDLAAPKGTAVNSIASGIVIDAGITGNYGKSVFIQHDNDYVSFYAQLSEIKVQEGQNVKQSQLIGLVGSSGMSTAPHLHLEVRRNGDPVDPQKYIDF